jgi:glutaredoxin
VHRRVIVYTRPLCLFCEQVADLLTESCIPFEKLELVSAEEQRALSQRYDAANFPIVIAGGAYIGGFTHIVRLHATGRLSELLGPPGSVTSASTSSTSSIPPPPTPRVRNWTSQMSELAKKKGPR